MTVKVIQIFKTCMKALCETQIQAFIQQSLSPFSVAQHPEILYIYIAVNK